MKKNCVQFVVFIIMILSFGGCAASSKTEKMSVERKPAIILNIASLDLTRFKKRIERKHIQELTRVLKREGVEILAVQGISRYPGVSTRVDIVSELSSQIEWRNAFGETLNISGRQTGNAVFSLYPIISHRNITFDKIMPKSFETALQASIDAGIHSLLIINGQLPVKATIEEQTRCMKYITDLIPHEINQATVMAGDLPSSDIIRRKYSFEEIPMPKSVKGSGTNIWYLENPSVQLMSSHAAETELGTIIIAQLGLFRQQ